MNLKHLKYGPGRCGLGDESGSLLVSTLVVSGVIGLALAGYLGLVRAQSRAAIRSQMWNSLVPTMEAGVEEALAHLAKNGLTNVFGDGWAKEGALAVRSRQFGDGRYVVSISTNSTTTPTIECAAYVPTPMGVNGNTSTDIARAVRVTTRAGGALFSGLVGINGIKITGNHNFCDSYDSLSAPYSTATRRDKCEILTNASGNKCMDLSHILLYGYARTGPGGQASLNSCAGAVGDLSWINAGNTGIQAGHLSQDMNMTFPEVTLPFTSGITPSGGTVTITNTTATTSTVTAVTAPASGTSYTTTTGAAGNNVSGWNKVPVPTPPVVTTNSGKYSWPAYTKYTYSVTSNVVTTESVTATHLLGTGNYRISGGRLDKGTVVVKGNAVVICEVEVKQSNSDRFIIMPGASLTWYQVGDKVDFTACKGGVENMTGKPQKFLYYGLPTNVEIKVKPNYDLIAAFYAPNADFRLQQGNTSTAANDYLGFFGGGVFKTVDLGCKAQFHFDEDLARNGPMRSFMIDQWVEIPPPRG